MGGGWDAASPGLSQADSGIPSQVRVQGRSRGSVPAHPRSAAMSWECKLCRLSKRGGSVSFSLPFQSDHRAPQTF